MYGIENVAQIVGIPGWRMPAMQRDHCLIEAKTYHRLSNVVEIICKLPTKTVWNVETIYSTRIRATGRKCPGTEITCKNYCL